MVESRCGLSKRLRLPTLTYPLDRCRDKSGRLCAESKIKTSAPVSLRANFRRGCPIRACALTSCVHFLATYFPRLMIGKHAWQAQILDVIRYVLLLQHPSDLEEVTSRESANLSTIKTGSIVPREIASLSLGCPGPRFGSDFGYE